MNAPGRRGRQSGFTLIETLVYLALFSIVIGGGLVTAYQVIAGAERTNATVMAEEEGNFLLRKIDWALTSATAIGEPSAGLSGPRLIVTKLGLPVSENPLTIDSVSGVVRLARGTSDPVALTNVRVPITGLSFARSTSGASNEITLSFAINGQPFALTRYVGF